MSEEYWCCKCLRSYSSKQRFQHHFQFKNVQGSGIAGAKGGKLIPNECFNAEVKQYANSKREALALKRQLEHGNLSKYFSVAKKARPEVSVAEVTEIQHALETDVATTDNIQSENVSQSIITEKAGDPEKSNVKEPVTEALTPQSNIDQEDQSAIAQTLERIEKKQDELVRLMKSLTVEIPVIDPASVKPVHQNASKSSTKTTPSHQSTLNIDKSSIKSSFEDMLKSASSMEVIMLNPLVNGVFQFVPVSVSASYNPLEDTCDELMKECFLKCQICPNDSRNGRIYVPDKNYACKHFGVMEPWFSNLKKTIRRHVSESEVHRRNLKEMELNKNEIESASDDIKRNLRYLVYYILRTNTAFLSFPKLLATVYQCDMEIGNINHSRDFVSRILPLIDDILQENTKNWIMQQGHISISLDIGTVMGLVILVVYFTGEDGCTRLAGCDLTSKKDGRHCAELCYKIATSNIHIQERIIQGKTTGIVADGAFVDGNQPFKQRIRELFINPNMVFRWDLLHLCNRAHISARGLTQVDLSGMNAADQQQNQAAAGTSLVTHMMNYVQSESKKWRTGIPFTQLVIETTDFMRPKLYSSTRMCLYEFDQIKRFIEVQHYFDVPFQWDVMSKIYCLIMFTEKIILKTAQKSDDQREYVNRVILGLNLVEPEGKTAMKLALRVGKDVIRGQPIAYLDNGQHVDIISTTAQNNVFVHELKTLIENLGNKLIPESLVNTRHRTRNQQRFTVEIIEDAVEDFIDKLWEEIARRSNRTDLTSRSCWCFSEAPCESFFSKWGKIVEARPSLTFENIFRLVRIQLEGPPAGTEKSHEVMTAAMRQYRSLSHFGERYCTLSWVPNAVSSTVRKVIQKPWEYSAFSNF